jgi:S-DNA-T family DNA segregation ATPase FtsK/SpoIIIE
MIRQATAKELQLNGDPLSVEDCRDLVVETKVLENLKLFEFLFAGWPSVEAARAASAKTAAPAVAATAPAPVAAEQAPAPKAVPPAEPRPSPVPQIPAPVPIAAPTATAPNPTPPPPPPAPPAPNAGVVWAEAMLGKVVQKLRVWGQPVTPKGVEVGPTFVRLKVEPRDNTDFNIVKRKADNLKLHLSLAQRPLIEAQAGYISIDVERPDRQTVTLPPLLASRPADLHDRPAFPVGVDVAGRAHWLDLSSPSTCHLLIAGTTGSGKSAFMRAILAGLAHGLGPDRLQFVLIDPKRLTFNFHGASPYLRRPVAYDLDEALPLIEECFNEMESRYVRLQKFRADHIGQLTGADAMPHWVLVFEEFADLMADKENARELVNLLKRIGAKARAAGIHLVLTTQRTEASVVTPLLRSNLPGRLSLQVISEKDSKLILESPQAAYLLGLGDLLWRQGGGMIRLQSPFVQSKELEAALRFH